MTSDNKRLERQIEHLKAAHYALFAMFLVVCSFASWANRLLNKIAKQILFPIPYSLIPVPKEPQ